MHRNRLKLHVLAAAVHFFLATTFEFLYFAG